MSNINALEKVEYPLLQFSSLHVMNLVTLGNTSYKDKSKLPYYSARTYTSSKYSNITSVVGVNITTNDFLSFKYKKLKDYSEVLFSYPHMYELLIFFQKIVSTLETEESFLINEGRLYVSVNYQDDVYKVQGINDKSLIAVLEVVEDDDKYEHRGIMLYVNGETSAIPLYEREVMAIYYFIKTFNLALSSQMLVNTAINSMILERMNGEMPDVNSNAVRRKRSSETSTSKKIVRRNSSLSPKDEEYIEKKDRAETNRLIKEIVDAGITQEDIDNCPIVFPEDKDTKAPKKIKKKIVLDEEEIEETKPVTKVKKKIDIKKKVKTEEPKSTVKKKSKFDDLLELADSISVEE